MQNIRENLILYSYCTSIVLKLIRKTGIGDQETGRGGVFSLSKVKFTKKTFIETGGKRVTNLYILIYHAIYIVYFLQDRDL